MAVAFFSIAAGLLIGVGVIFTQKNNKITTASILFLFATIVVWLVGTLLSGSFQLSAYYVAIPCAFVIMNTSPRLFFNLLVLHLFISIGVQAVEYLTGNYLFVYEVADKAILDEKLFGGQSDVFRAKGLFQGPLSAVAFAYWTAFLSQRRILPVLTLLLCAFLAGGRLGVTVSITLLLLRVLSVKKYKNYIMKSKGILAKIGIGLLLIALIILIIFSNENRIKFLTSAYDINNPQNTSRIIYWALSFQYFMNYSMLEMIAGNMGFIRKTLGGTENDFLRILLDHGLIGLFLYVAAMFYISLAALRGKSVEFKITVALIFILMNVFPYIQSLPSSILFWIFVFATPYLLPNQNPGRANVGS